MSSEKDLATKNHEAGAIDLVGGIIDEARELVGAHVEALRDDITERLSSLGAALTSTLLAFSVLIVTTLLFGLSLAATIEALGLPWWAAFWIVTLAAAALGFGLVQRARRQASATTSAAGPAAELVRDDLAFLASAATAEDPAQPPTAA